MNQSDNAVQRLAQDLLHDAAIVRDIHAELGRSTGMTPELATRLLAKVRTTKRMLDVHRLEAMFLEYLERNGNGSSQGESGLATLDRSAGVK